MTKHVAEARRHIGMFSGLTTYIGMVSFYRNNKKVWSNQLNISRLTKEDALEDARLHIKYYESN